MGDEDLLPGDVMVCKAYGRQCIRFVLGVLSFPVFLRKKLERKFPPIRSLWRESAVPSLKKYNRNNHYARSFPKTSICAFKAVNAPGVLRREKTSC